MASLYRVFCEEGAFQSPPPSPQKTKPSVFLPWLPTFIFITYLGSRKHGVFFAYPGETKAQREDLSWPLPQRASLAALGWHASLGLAVLVLMSLCAIAMMAIALVLAHRPAHRARQSQSGHQGCRSAQPQEDAFKGDKAYRALSPSSQGSGVAS